MTNTNKCIATLDPDTGNVFVLISSVGVQHRSPFIVIGFMWILVTNLSSMIHISNSSVEHTTTTQSRKRRLKNFRSPCFSNFSLPTDSLNFP